MSTITDWNVNGHYIMAPTETAAAKAAFELYPDLGEAVIVRPWTADDQAELDFQTEDNSGLVRYRLHNHLGNPLKAADGSVIEFNTDEDARSSRTAWGSYNRVTAVWA